MRTPATRLFVLALAPFLTLLHGCALLDAPEERLRRRFELEIRYLEADSPVNYALLASSLSALGDWHSERDKWDISYPLYSRALDSIRTHLSNSNPLLLAAIDSRELSAFSSLDENVFKDFCMLTHRPGPPKLSVNASWIADFLLRMGRAEWAAGSWQDADHSFRKIVLLNDKCDYPLEHPYTRISAAALRNLAEMHRELGRTADAEAAYLRLLQKSESTGGSVRYELYSKSVLRDVVADFFVEIGRYAKAEEIFRQNLEERSLRTIPGSSWRMLSLRDLASILRKQGKLAEAALFESESAPFWNQLRRNPEEVWAPDMGTVMIALHQRGMVEEGCLFLKSLAAWSRTQQNPDGPKDPDFEEACTALRNHFSSRKNSRFYYGFPFFTQLRSAATNPSQGLHA